MRLLVRRKILLAGLISITIFAIETALRGQAPSNAKHPRQIFPEKLSGAAVTLPDSFISEQGNFHIHYTTQGEHAVPDHDENQNHIPDWVEKIGAAFEKSYSTEILELGYVPPPNMSDGSPYHIYIQNLNTYFARTVPLNFDSSKTTNTNLSSFILFDNDFAGQNYRIQGDSAIKVIAAHEFFHAVQMGYVFRQIDGFFLELTAVWLESQVFPEIPDYRYFLDYFFAAPEIPLSGVSYTIPNVIKHIYGRSIWAFFIAQKYGVESIRRIFELMVEKPALEAMDVFFRNNNSSFADEFSEFAVWNYFTGSRHLQNFGYSGAGSLPEIPLKADTTFEYFADKNGAGYFLTAGYYLFHPKHSGNLKIIFSTDNSLHWQINALLFNDEILSNQKFSAGKITVPGISPSTSLLIIPCNIDRSADPRTIYYKQKPEKYYFSLSLERNADSQSRTSFEIVRATPNPFESKIKFSFKKKTASQIRMEVFNVLGQKVDVKLIGQNVESWQWAQPSNQAQLFSGIYFFRFSDAKNSQTIRAIHCN